VSFFDDTPERVPPRFDRPGDRDWTRPEGVIPGVGTGGSERQWDGRFWVHPLPPGGPVTFVASWLLYEVADVDGLIG
jgi:hypothetical protein